jgi:hypothetical protein
MRGSPSELFFRIERRDSGEEPLVMAASYILASINVWVGVEASFDRLLAAFSSESLWVEKCPGFEQMAAIHFDPMEVDMFDEVLMRATELGMHSCPDYITEVTLSGSSLFTSRASTSKPLSGHIYSDSKLAIIDTPIYTSHEFLRSCDIVQDERYSDVPGCDHGTFIAAIVTRINPYFRIYSFPVISMWSDCITLCSQHRASYYSFPSSE